MAIDARASSGSRPSTPSFGASSSFAPGDSVLESSFGERLSLSGNLMSRWMGWRLRMLVLAALRDAVHWAGDEPALVAQASATYALPPPGV